MEKNKIRISHPSQEGAMQLSKWLTFRVLLDADEMEDLFDVLGEFLMFNVSELVPLEKATFSKECFLENYREYIGALKQGKLVDERKIKPLFSSVLTTSTESIYGIGVKKDLFIIKPTLPVIQLGAHHFTYSPMNTTFQSMIHSQDAISWGIQFSYPQIYSNSKIGDIVEVLKDPSMPNTIPFRVLTKWMRKHSRPMAFSISDQKVVTKFRIGKKCLEWVAMHPQLGNLEVKT